MAQLSSFKVTDSLKKPSPVTIHNVPPCSAAVRPSISPPFMQARAGYAAKSHRPIAAGDAWRVGPSVGAIGGLRSAGPPAAPGRTPSEFPDRRRSRTHRHAGNPVGRLEGDARLIVLSPPKLDAVRGAVAGKVQIEMVRKPFARRDPQTAPLALMSPIRHVETLCSKSIVPSMNVANRSAERCSLTTCPQSPVSSVGPRNDAPP